MNPSRELDALVTLLAEGVFSGDRISGVLASCDVQFPNVVLAHIVYTLGKRKHVIAVAVEMDVKPVLFRVYWPVSVEVKEVKDMIIKEGSVTSETMLVASGMQEAVSIVRAIVLTEKLKTSNDGKEDDRGREAQGEDRTEESGQQESSQG